MTGGDHMTELLAKYRKPRTRNVRLVVVHVNQGPDSHGGAVGVAQYCQRDASQRKGSKGGYHVIVDDVQTIVTAHADEVVQGAGGANEDGFHVCMVGDANQSDQQWHDAFSVANCARAAEAVRNACTQLGVPPTLLTTDEVKAGKSGICGHVHVSQAFHKSTHTDPGPNFPWQEFMAQVGNGAVIPAPTPNPGGLAGVGAALQFIRRHPLRRGDRGENVRLVQQILINKGAKQLTADGIFGRATEAVVKFVQAASHLTADGIVGTKTIDVLLAQ
jgi:hypothetical protein